MTFVYVTEVNGICMFGVKNWGLELGEVDDDDVEVWWYTSFWCVLIL